MSEIFKKNQQLVDDFNKKYGTNFSFEQYETNQLRLYALEKNFPNAKKGNIGAENSLYRGTLLNLYKEHVDIAILERRDDYPADSLLYDRVKSPAEFAADFEALMDGYRDFCNEQNGRKAPDKYGAWKRGGQIMEAMKEKISEISNKDGGLIDKADYVKKEYLAGRFPLSRMRIDIENIKVNLFPSTEEISRAINYVRALDKVSRERSVFAFLNPFKWARMYSERRESSALTDLIEKFKDKYPGEYSSALELADGKSSFAPIFESIENDTQNIKDLEEAKAEEIARSREALGMGIFFQVDYRPDINQLPKEKAMAEKLINAINKKQIFVENTKENSTIKQLIYRNQLRLLMTTEERVNNPEWEKYCNLEDKNFKNDHPDYKVPDEIPVIPEGSVIENNDQIDLNNRLNNEFSEKPQIIEEKHIEEPVKSNVDKSLN